MSEKINVGAICNRLVVFADTGMTLSDAASLMREHHVGSLVVVEERDQGRVPKGMVTDRDIVVAVVARDADARTITVGDAMSSNLVTVREEDSVCDAPRWRATSARRRGGRRADRYHNA